MNDLQPKPGQIGQIYAKTWDDESKQWFLIPYTLDELIQGLSSE
jgi:hypothetical protein